MVLPVTGVQCCKSCPDFTDKVLVPEPPPLTLSPKSTRAVVTVASGEEGRELLELSRPWMEKYAAREKADFVVLDWEGYPGWGQSSKFQLYRVLDFYERVVYLDADTLADPDSVPSLFGLVPEKKFGIYDELPGLTERGHHSKFLREYQYVCETQGLPATLPTFYGNTGVMVFSKKHKEVLRPPEFPVPPLHCSEQHLWVGRLQKEDIEFLPRGVNFQWWENQDSFSTFEKKNIYHFSGLRPGKTCEYRLGFMRDFLHAAGKVVRVEV